MGPTLLPTPLSPACGPASRYLAPGVSPLVTRRLARGYVARRSRRCRIVTVAGSGPKTCPLPPCNPRPWGCAALQCRSRVRQGASALAAATGVRLSGLHDGGYCGLQRAGFRIALAGASLCRSSTCGILPPDRSCLVFPQGIGRRSFEAVPFAFDKGRMRARTESAQAGGVRLIHFWRKGQWTRLDKSTARRKGAVGAPYLRSRWARRRRRSALSLMKPAASFWS